MKTARLATVAILSALFFSPPILAKDDVTLIGTLDCQLAAENSNTHWTVELDSSIPIAVLDDHDHPAEYSNEHIQIRLALEGPVITIGRASGRLLLSDAHGKTMGTGRCGPLAYI